MEMNIHDFHPVKWGIFKCGSQMLIRKFDSFDKETTKYQLLSFIPTSNEYFFALMFKLFRGFSNTAFWIQISVLYFFFDSGLTLKQMNCYIVSLESSISIILKDKKSNEPAMCFGIYTKRTNYYDFWQNVQK